MFAISVDQLRQAMDQAKAKLDQRSIELEDLLLECRQFNHQVDEFQQCISMAEEDCETHVAEAAKASSAPAVEKLVSANKVSEFVLLISYTQ